MSEARENLKRIVLLLAKGGAEINREALLIELKNTQHIIENLKELTCTKN